MPDLTLSSVEKLLDKRLTDLATKTCISGLKELIVKQADMIKKQAEEISKLKEEAASHSNRIDILESQVSVFQNTINVLKRNNDDSEQYSRRLCLRINGIEPAVNEKASDCLNKVKRVIKELGVVVPDQCIDRAHRIGNDYTDKSGKSQRGMIVRFTTWRHRTAIFRARKSKKEYSIRLDLTKKRLKLLNDARAMLGEDSEKVEFVFADVNCRIMAKMANGGFKEFHDMDEFSDLCSDKFFFCLNHR